METRFVWRDEFNIGVDAIDKEHKRLFQIISRLYALQEEDTDSRWANQEGIKFFNRYTLRHFADEEAYMSSIGYKGLEQHRRIHRRFSRDALPMLEQELQRNNYSQKSLEHFWGVCAGWLISHTMTADLAITGQDMRHGGDELPDNKLTAMRKVVARVMFDMFHLESQLVSDAYNGEKFSKGIYYRLIYDTKQGDQQQEFIMACEEKLLFNTVGYILGFQSNKLNNMMLHAARHATRQMVNRFIAHFPDLAASRLQEEQVLSYAQFQQVMAKENRQISLLFNTGGAGYFAFCITAPHMLENSAGPIVLNADNAMDEVNNYLVRRQEQEKQDKLQHRPQILVVEASQAVRQSLKRLLDGAYEVALAGSVAAAIRAIALNRPDLILLDYEMPSCDGQQALAMLHANKNFADIPVFFLTDSEEPQSLPDLTAPQPAGWLLKNLEPAQLKSKLDAYLAPAANE